MSGQQLTLDLGVPVRAWGAVRPGDIVPQRQKTWHPEHGLGETWIRMRVTRVDDRGGGVLGVEMAGLTGQVHGRYYHYRVDEEVESPWPA